MSENRRTMFTAVRKPRPAAAVCALAAAALVVVLLGYPDADGPGAPASPLGIPLPALGFWQGAEDSPLIGSIECINLASDPAVLLQQVVRSDGIPYLFPKAVEVAPRGISLTPIVREPVVPPQPPNTPLDGMYVIDSLPDVPAPKVQCHNALTRKDASGQFAEWAASIPLTAPYQGLRHGIFNSFGPAGGGDGSWYQDTVVIFNPGSQTLAGAVHVFRRQGEVNDGPATEPPIVLPFSLQPGQTSRTPLTAFSGQSAGTYTIAPENLSSPYNALHVRTQHYKPSSQYWGDADIPVFAQPASGTQDSGYMLLSDMDRERNILEIGNTGFAPEDVTIEIFDRYRTLQKVVTVPLAGRAEKHIDVNFELLPGVYLSTPKIGYIRVKKVSSNDAQGGVLIQILRTGITQEPGNPSGNSRMWSYISQPTAPQNGFTAPINTALQAENWLKVYNVGSGLDLVPINIRIFSADGTEVPPVPNTLIPRNAMLSPGGVQQFPLHSEVGPNFSGRIVVTADFSSGKPPEQLLFNAELIRVYPQWWEPPMGQTYAQGGRGYVTNAPVSIDPSALVPPTPTPTPPPPSPTPSKSPSPSPSKSPSPSPSKSPTPSPAPYCTARSTYTNRAWIKQVVLGTQSHQSGAGTGGYQDFTWRVLPLARGAQTTLTLTPGYPISPWPAVNWLVYIDYNRNGYFTDPGEQVYVTNNKTGAISTTITAPQLALTGKTRMRVRMWLGTYPYSACGNVTYGEVEDYTVDISPGSPPTPTPTPSGGYCRPSSNNSLEWIAKVQAGSFINTSLHPTGGYEDFTSKVIAVPRGVATTFSLTPGYSGTAYAENWGIWIDYNRNGSFDDAGEWVFRSASATAATQTATVTVPTTVAAGNTRLRIRMWYGSTAPANSCAATTFGETEDYTVNTIVPMP